MAPRLKDRPARTAAAAAAAKPKGGDGRPLDPSDNRRSARDEADQAQFLSAAFKYRAKLREIDAAKEVVAARNAEAKEILDLAVAAGFKKYEIVDNVKDLIKPKVNHTEIEDRRAKFREWLGLPAGRRPTDDLKLPTAARDELDWESEGYRAGIRADEPKPPKECPSMFTQAWMKGYHNGQARNAQALAFKPAAAAPPVADPEPEKEPTRAELKAEEKRVREGLEKLGAAAPAQDEEVV